MMARFSRFFTESGMQDFKNLRAWHLAHRLSLVIGESCDARVFSRRPALRRQMIRTADSIPSNIAEGAAKEGAEFVRFLNMALGATNELENDLIKARDIGYIPVGRSNRLIDRTDHVRRATIRLIQSIRKAR